MNNEGDPKIKVTIKPRAKDKPTDDFRLNISYEISMTSEQKQKLSSDVPITPVGEKPEIEFSLEDIEEENLVTLT